MHPANAQIELLFSLNKRFNASRVMVKQKRVITVYIYIYVCVSVHFRHALPLFTSLLNCLCSYDPVGYGVPYNHLMFSDHREPLVEISLQVLCVTMENDTGSTTVTVDGTSGGTAMDQGSDVSSQEVSVSKRFCQTFHCE